MHPKADIIHSFYEHVQTILSAQQFSSTLITQPKLDRVQPLCEGLPCVWMDETLGPINEEKVKHWVASKDSYMHKLICEDASKVIMKHKPQVSYQPCNH